MDKETLFAGGICLLLGIILFLYAYPDVMYYNTAIGRAELQLSARAKQDYQNAQVVIFLGATLSVIGFVVCLYGAVVKEGES